MNFELETSIAYSMSAAVLITATLFMLAAAIGSSDANACTTSLAPTLVSETGPDACPSVESEEVLQEIRQNVSSLLQDVVSCSRLGSSPAFAAGSCAEIADDSPSGNYWILSSTGTPFQAQCVNANAFPATLSLTGRFMRVASLNMTDPDEQCPVNFQLYTDMRLCGKTSDDACDSATYTTYGIQYQRVCGRVKGYQFGSPDAFHAVYGSCSYPCPIDGTYVDGVSITHGDSPRKHIWTYVGAVYSVNHTTACPCTGGGASPPDYVGSDYYCESGNPTETTSWRLALYSSDPLWDGQGCNGDEGTCCSYPNLPWFCKELPEPTTDDLEVRICGDEPQGNEDTPIELLELYIQ